MAHRNRPFVRILRGALAFALSSIVLLLVLEGLLRMGLHARGGPLDTLAAPWRCGSYFRDDAYWEMVARAGPPEALRDPPEFDPRYGWRCWLAQADTLAHRDEAALAGRRPLLLFGDSYASGVIPDTWRDFPALVERSDLAGEYAPLNYGTGGHGLDQIWLQMRDVLARHAGSSPVVIASLLIDDDIDRCVLSFRSGPKPRLRVRDGRLVGDDRPVPGMREYFERHADVEPLLVAPFLANHLDRLVGVRTRRLEREKQELGRALLRAMVDELRAREVPFLFVLFHHSWSLLHPGAEGWRAALVQDTLDELGAPWVTVRPALIEHARRTGRAIEDYFLAPEHPSSGHYNALGDAVAFEVVREGLRQHLGLGAGGNLVLAQDVRVADGAAPPQWREEDEELATHGLQPPFLWTALDAQGCAELRWRPRGAAWALRGRAPSPRAELRLECVREGVAQALDERFEVDLEGVDELLLRAYGPPAARLLLSELGLEAARRLPPPLGPDPR